MPTSSETPARIQPASLPRTTFLIIAGLMVFSTVLFLVGSMIERGNLPTQIPTETHQEAGEGSEMHEGGEATPTTAAEGTEAQERSEAGATEAPVFGLNLESPWVIGAVVIGTVLLIAGLYYWGYPVLWLALVIAVAGAVLDVREILHQLAVSEAGVATLAGVVGLVHIATAIAAVTALRMSSLARPRAASTN